MPKEAEMERTIQGWILGMALGGLCGNLQTAQAADGSRDTPIGMGPVVRVVRLPIKVHSQKGEVESAVEIVEPETEKDKPQVVRREKTKSK
ncbi:MAG: hypothetical protein D6720_07505 [Gammaproteobacteria bacterium]|nr:MAG: hypothetical protein D6720_07505 [Gammaproteobacteria bacterium]